jgi:NADH-quinone oxidoreductase subunit F
LGSHLGLEIFVHMRAGRYLCGEASAMLSAIEGRRALPRFRPPHMASAGLWARPTIVNNPETMSCVPSIVLNGQQWWLDLGRSQEGGTKIYTVAGRVRNPGAWELPMGTAMREIVEQHAGGMLEGYRLKAVIPGGASSAMVPAHCLDVAMDFSSMKAIGSSLGTGTMIVIDDRTPILGVLLNLERFYAQESCGWCTPCWSGTQWMVSLLEDIQAGRGRTQDAEMLEHLAWAMKSEHCFCDHGPSASRALLGGLRWFRDEITQRLSA